MALIPIPAAAPAPGECLGPESDFGPAVPSTYLGKMFRDDLTGYPEGPLSSRY